MNIFQSNKNYKGHHIIVKEAVQQEDTILNEHALKIDLQNALEKGLTENQIIKKTGKSPNFLNKTHL